MPKVDPARLVAFEVLRAVGDQDAYANLELSRLLRESRLSGRDAALATELVGGTLRLQGSYSYIQKGCDDMLNMPTSKDTNWLGIVYTAVTQWLGFPKYGDEGKVMGLAPYGKPRYLDRLRGCVRLTRDGFELDGRQVFAIFREENSPRHGSQPGQFVDWFDIPKIRIERRVA